MKALTILYVFAHHPQWNFWKYSDGNEKISLRVGSAKRTNYVLNGNVVAWMRPELAIVEHTWHPREKFNTHFVSFSEHPANPDLSHIESFVSDGEQCFEERKIQLLDLCGKINHFQ